MPFNGGGFGGGFGFGQAPAPLAAASAQSVGVAQYGSVWASSNCPSCNVAITEMQALINQVARQLGVAAQISVDGKVGAGTVQALLQVANAAVIRGNAVASVLPGYATPEMVAKNADKIRDILRQVATATPATAPTPLPSVPTGPTAPAPAPSYPFPTPNTAPSAAAKSKLPYVIGGAILFVGVIAAGVILMTPKPGA